MGVIVKELEDQYKIWKYYGQLLECRTKDEYGSGRLIFFLEVRKDIDVDEINWFIESLKLKVSKIESILPKHLKHIKLYTRATALFPEISANSNKSEVSKSYDVFISYSYKNQSPAKKLKEKLEKAGFECFLSSDKLKSGDPLEQHIKDALKNSRELCLIYSQESSNSYWVLSEWAAAWVLDKTAVTFLYKMNIEYVKSDHAQRIKSGEFLIYNERDITEYIKDLRYRKLKLM